MNKVSANRAFLRFIIIVSIAIPLVVALLLYFPLNLAGEGSSWVRVLPTFHAIVNSVTAVLLVAAFFAIRQKRIQLHRNLMTAALVCGVLFLLSYVTYHSAAPSTIYGDVNHDGVLDDVEQLEVGGTRTFYVVVLLSHILLSIVVVPFVLLAFYFALSGQISRHQKVVKFAFPVWLYVSVTGVIVYLLISPYYP